MGEDLQCAGCSRRFPIIAGIPDLRVFPDPYIDFEADRKKGLQVAARLADCTFSELIDYYYSMTSVVPPHHARLYKRGLMAGVGRARAALAAWEKMAGAGSAGGSMLEVGCGTAPLLVAAAGGPGKTAGVDIAFRWLVVAKKRLEEAGQQIPLICACAEALPFPAGTFDRVVMDSVLEVATDQTKALHECHRVMRPGAHLFLSTPNRFSLGPDPHVGAWAGGLWPQRWLAAYARRQGAIPPKRSLLWVLSLATRLRESGFAPCRIFLPGVPAEQRNQFARPMRALIDLYRAAQRLPLSRQLLYLIGPWLYAVTKKPRVSGGIS